MKTVVNNHWSLITDSDAILLLLIYAKKTQ